MAHKECCVLLCESGTGGCVWRCSTHGRAKMVRAHRSCVVDVTTEEHGAEFASEGDVAERVEEGVESRVAVTDPRDGCDEVKRHAMFAHSHH